MPEEKKESIRRLLLKVSEQEARAEQAEARLKEVRERIRDALLGEDAVLAWQGRALSIGLDSLARALDSAFERVFDSNPPQPQQEEPRCEGIEERYVADSRKELEAERDQLYSRQREIDKTLWRLGGQPQHQEPRCRNCGRQLGKIHSPGCVIAPGQPVQPDHCQPQPNSQEVTER